MTCEETASFAYRDFIITHTKVSCLSNDILISFEFKTMQNECVNKAKLNVSQFCHFMRLTNISRVASMNIKEDSL